MLAPGASNITSAWHACCLRPTTTPYLLFFAMIKSLLISLVAAWPQVTCNMIMTFAKHTCRTQQATGEAV